MRAPEKITMSYERRLIRRLMYSDMQTNALYRQFAERVAPVLSQYRMNMSGVLIRDAELDRNLNAEMKRFGISMDGVIRDNQVWAWGAANDKTDEIIRFIVGRTSVSKIVESGLFRRNIDAFDAFQKRKYNGMQLSDRVWSLTQGNRQLMTHYLESGLSTGRSAQQIGQDVRRLLNEPDKLFRRIRNPKTGELKLSKPAQDYHPGRGVYRSSAQNARRLARTEVNMAYRTADQERWKGLDIVLGYEVKLSNSHPVTDICDYLKGRYPKNFAFRGWHPACLCYTVPVLASKDELLDNVVDGKPITGHVRDVPDGFKSYMVDHRDQIGGWKRQPFWVQDNFKGGRIEKGLK